MRTPMSEAISSYKWLTVTLERLDALMAEFERRVEETKRKHSAEIVRLAASRTADETAVFTELERHRESQKVQQAAAEQSHAKIEEKLREDVEEIEKNVRETLRQRRVIERRRRAEVAMFVHKFREAEKLSRADLFKLIGRDIAAPLNTKAAETTFVHADSLDSDKLSKELEALDKLRSSLGEIAPGLFPGVSRPPKMVLFGAISLSLAGATFVLLRDPYFSSLLAVAFISGMGRASQLRQREQLQQAGKELLCRIHAALLVLEKIDLVQDETLDRESQIADGELAMNQQSLKAKLNELQREAEIQTSKMADELATAERKSGETLAFVRADYDRRRADTEQRHLDALRNLNDEFAANFIALERSVFEFTKKAGFAAIPWKVSEWSAWEPVRKPNLRVQLGQFEVRRPAVTQHIPGLSDAIVIPALHDFDLGRAFAIVPAGDRSREAAVSQMQSAAFRLLANIPPGKLRFLLVDPVGLGQNVAPLLALADHDETLIGSRPWSSEQHIEEKLDELGEHLEVVFHKYLRDDYDSISAYNEAAEEVAEPYRALLIFDFPWGFSSRAAERLVSIVQNGPRCGIFTLLIVDPTKTPPHGFRMDDVMRHAVKVTVGRESRLSGRLEERTLLTECAPPTEIARMLVEKIGVRAKDASRVEVSFSKLQRLSDRAETAQLWSESSIDQISVHLGVRGARRTQVLTIGADGSTAHHGLVVGRTGSGKTNLFNVLITNLALSYSPSEVRLYLVDFKGGVSFKPYAEYKLPHAASIAIESEREFGISVLQGAVAEMERRSNLFRDAQVANFGDYRRRTQKPLPRLVVIFDEFQLLFSEEDNISQRARQLIESIVRQGRGYGIHLFLGSQNLAGSAALPASIIDQMVIRMALQCSDADARAILAHDNPAARMLNRNGEAIFNAAAGLVEGNSPFQVAHLPDTALRELLEKIRGAADSQGLVDVPIVFEGDKPGELSSCLELWKSPDANDPPARFWLGEATSLRPPVDVILQRQNGRNVLIVERNELSGCGMLFSAWLGLLRGFGVNDATFYVLDLSGPDTGISTLIRTIAESFPHRFKQLNRRNLAEFFGQANTEIGERLNHPSSSSGSDSVFLLIFGLQRARDLKPDTQFELTSDASDLPKLFATILRDGPEAGYHTIAWAESCQGACRILEGSLREFGVRVAGTMSVEDSQTIIEDSAAARLARGYRSLLYDDEQPGTLEKLRPFAPPTVELVQKLSQSLTNRTNEQPSPH